MKAFDGQVMSGAILALLSLQGALPVCAQSEEWKALQRTWKVRPQGHWTDPSTGLMWTTKDNGKDVRWGRAVRYCRNLRAGGYRDWRLAKIDELESLIIDKESYVPRHEGRITHLRFNVDLETKGGLLLSDQSQWSGSPSIDADAKRTGFAWYFDFANVRRNIEDATFFGSRRRALCVREIAN